MNNRIIKTVCLFIICTTLSGCTTKEIKTQADEITLSTWEYKGDNGAYACIDFGNTDACITLSSSGKTLQIKGICVFNDKYFTVNDNRLQRSFVFGYDFSGTKLGVAYNGHKADFSNYHIEIR